MKKPTQTSNNDTSKSNDSDAQKSRRDFLKKSKYAVYATPLITSLIINQKAAADSGGPAGPPSFGGF